ncbi:MAG TPA: D-alanine--D-alanine ligase family protein [Actinomycetota bacterium]|nr:D-alanine--D-alanine ligase family protein [Actinomycetota bacterium]
MSPSPDRRLRVMLLFGGQSAEHDVSRVSAVAVARALDPARYDVVPVAITREGRWLLADRARAALESGQFPPAFDVDGAPVRLAEKRAGLGSAVVRLESGGNPLGAVDVAFPLLHGPYGEDGTVQGLLELAGLPYVGSGVLGSAVGMDKVMMKRAFTACGLATPRSVALREDGVTKAELDRCQDLLGYPCFVKPANLGSSVGVSKATDRPALEEAVDVALRFDEWILVEEAISGREIEVAVLGDRPPEASLPGEIVPGADFYTYEDKYLDDSAELRAPTDLDPDRTAEVRRLAVAAFDACRCEAMARVDFFLEDPGRGFLVNEVNTIPGFTPISMYPRLWEVTGVPYPELLDRLVALALERHERRAERAGRPRDV